MTSHKGLIAAVMAMLMLVLGGGILWHGSHALNVAHQDQEASAKALDKATRMHRRTSMQHHAATTLDQAAGNEERMAHPDAQLLGSMHTADDATMDRFFTQVYTWDSAGVYTRHRDAVIHDWHIGENTPFMQRFFAPAQCHTAADQERFCVIDTQHLSSVYRSVTSMMTAYNNGVRSYVGTVTSSSYSTDGSASIDRTARFAWTMGPQGNLLAIDWINANQ